MITERVAGIIDRVRKDGDAALLEMAREFDGVALESLEVPRSALRRALDGVDVKLRRAMERSVRNLETVQRSWLPVASEIESEPGVRVGRRPDALSRVGVYAPGGRAAYPSSVLMGCVPARVAGVGEIVLCSPPGASGLPSDVVMAAAELAGADRVFAVGGAGAIAAMAYGTAAVPCVDKIVGPGNAYVAEAKTQVAQVVGIDSPAGPSELLVIADSSANPEVIAREVMAQAEHDPLTRVMLVLVGCDEAGVRLFEKAIEDAVPEQNRREIIEQALRNERRVIAVAGMDEAVRVAEEFAPEHLLLVVRDSDSVLPRLRNCGTIFVGEYSSVAFGDYMTGANHVLPTGGMARCYSGLSVMDFIRWTSYQIVSREAAAGMAEDVGVFANAEGLPAHANTALQWKGGSNE